MPTAKPDDTCGWNHRASMFDLLHSCWCACFDCFPVLTPQLLYVARFQLSLCSSMTIALPCDFDCQLWPLPCDKGVSAPRKMSVPLLSWYVAMTMSGFGSLMSYAMAAPTESHTVASLFGWCLTAVCDLAWVNSDLDCRRPRTLPQSRISSVKSEYYITLVCLMISLSCWRVLF